MRPIYGEKTLQKDHSMLSLASSKLKSINDENTSKTRTPERL
jgi:hypothetical protein